MIAKFGIFRGDDSQPDSIGPQVALILSTYQKPRHLKLVLTSIVRQQGVAGKLELVVTDDGSTDETPRIVERFARSVDFPVQFTTHEHQTFQLARCRNEGVAASAARYILFLDGDCILPSDFVFQHLARRRPGVALSGDCYRLDAETSSRLDEETIRRGVNRDWVLPSETSRLAKLNRKARWYSLIRHRSKPKLFGGNVAIWRSDFERVNGYDENFEGWGCEDDDLAYRLRQAGLRIASILNWARAYHVWHPLDTTAPARWRDGANVRRLLRPDRPVYALNGLKKSDPGKTTSPAGDGDPRMLPFRRPAEPILDRSQERKAA